MKKIIGFLKSMISDDSGNISSVRIMSWFALCIAAYSTIKLKDVSVEIIVSWLVAAFCPKVLQKVAEVWGSKNSTKIE